MRGLAVTLGCLIAATPAVAQSPRLAVGPDAGGYLCPDGRQLYVKSCYDDSPYANCGVVLMHLPLVRGYQQERTQTRAEITPSVADCKVYPLEFRDDFTVNLVLPKSLPPQQTASAPAATPVPNPVPNVAAQPAGPAARPDVASQARQAFLEGGRLYAQGDDDAALAAFARATKLDPAMRAAWVRQGQIHYARFDVERAIPFYEKAIELDPDDVEIADQLCIGYLLLGTSPDKGIAACQLRLKLKPQDPAPGYSAIAQLQQRKGDNKKALVSALEWARLAPAESLAWTTLAEIHVALGRNTDALTAMDKAVTLQPKDWSMRVQRGDIFRRLGKFTESIADYKAGIAIWPEGPKLHHGLADALRAAGRTSEADAEQRFAVRYALNNGRNALKKPADGSPLSIGSIIAAKDYLEMLEQWDRGAAAKLAAEIKAAERRVPADE